MSAPAGIAGMGAYLPERIMTAAELSELTGLSEPVVREKFGITSKRIAAEDEHVSDMAAAAARAALDNASVMLGESITADALDGILYFGSPHKEYPVWLAAPRIQQLLGAKRAWAFEIAAVSAGAPYALRVAADMMAADERLRTVLLVAASRESWLVDYENDRSRFMFNFGDGAAAAVLRRGHRANRVLASSFLTDGSFCESVRVPAGGSRVPASADTVARRLHYLDVAGPQEMKARLDPVTLDNFLHVARDAVRRSGHEPGEIGFLAMLHTKRSLYEAVMSGLELSDTQTVYLEQYGHMSAVDPLLALLEGERLGWLRPGMLALVLSAGTGYNWAATALAWGEAPGVDS